ncbi:MAG: prolipoprotein diacylglyceryl transferase [Geminicoccaceae bacterium]|nr:prolipoprotein diacylglyceryl transferase [Geminicoccaceae bacterium]MCS7267149.1 prolipoprotein diacylglyceryl transferase [Geminicoccaceae bacterium]MCX7629963.1 prolipoprotein diacylglyceryl transferase [Geminicoccaceae bacterium]MDW8124695.1 prolipoprotein diacylglyceryl transferase [Geminicoccaceae bacterium]MDW8341540.1 prolipoprotein diacylglyceryl transferase [Geminicoccaceae bacterium]
MFALPFPAIDPVAIAIGPIAIRWYALAYLAGILIGFAILKRLARRPDWGLSPAVLDDLLFYAVLGIIVGGRLGYVVFYNPGHYLAHPLDIPAVWQGGMSFHGGLLGVLAALLLVARKHALAPLVLGDGLAVAAPPGLFLGRLANFVNAELWGRPTDLPWGVIFPGGGPLPRHPSQLYEAALEGLLLGAVMLFLARRPYRREVAGRLAGVFLVGYGLARFGVEFVREPDPQLGLLLFGATMGQLLSAPMIVAGAFLLWRVRGR